MSLLIYVVCPHSSTKYRKPLIEYEGGKPPDSYTRFNPIWTKEKKLLGSKWFETWTLVTHG